jgi:hypothetical protein
MLPPFRLLVAISGVCIRVGTRVKVVTMIAGIILASVLFFGTGHLGLALISGAVIGWCLVPLLGMVLYMGTAFLVLAMLVGAVWLLVWLMLH